MSELAAPGLPAAKRVGRVLTYRKAAIAALLFPPTGVLALRRSLRAGKLAKQGEVESARIEGEKARDWVWYSVGIGLLVYLLAFFAFILLNNNAGVSRVYLSWKHLGNSNAWWSMLKGFWINAQVFLWAEALVLIWALVVAIVRMLPGKACGPIRAVATAYVDLFRAFPAILVVYLIGYGLPKAKVPMLADLSDMQYAIIALTLVYGAYVSEVYRAGIESIHWSQTAAARSLGLSNGQTMRFVVVPQAVRRVMPPLVNDFIGLQKDTAIIGFIGVNDVVQRARFYNNSQSGTLAGYTMAALLFFAVSVPLTRWFEWAQKRQRARVEGGRR